MNLSTLKDFQFNDCILFSTLWNYNEACLDFRRLQFLYCCIRQAKLQKTADARKVFNRGLTQAHFTSKIIRFYDSDVDARPHITRLDYGQKTCKLFGARAKMPDNALATDIILRSAKSQVQDYNVCCARDKNIYMMLAILTKWGLDKRIQVFHFIILP